MMDRYVLNIIDSFRYNEIISCVPNERARFILKVITSFEYNVIARCRPKCSENRTHTPE